MNDADMLHMLMEFQFPPNRFKPLVEWLEEYRFLPTGTYQWEYAVLDNEEEILRRLLVLNLERAEK